MNAQVAGQATVVAEAEAPRTEEAVPIHDGADFKTRVSQFEKTLLQRAMAEHRFNQRATADGLGLTYDQLRHALRRHGMLGN